MDYDLEDFEQDGVAKKKSILPMEKKKEEAKPKEQELVEPLVLSEGNFELAPCKNFEKLCTWSLAVLLHKLEANAPH